jgi:prepilin-type N-terminal cleavage/methylation domain-containing protein
MMQRVGYTIVELMVTIVIVAVLAATVGMFFVKLLTIQEREREEAYIREKLSDICAAYADDVSVGTSFYIDTNFLNQATAVKYNQETGGVSLETGRVSNVAYLTTQMHAFRKGNSTLGINNVGGVIELDVYSLSPEGLNKKISRTANGNAPLIPLFGNVINCTITPLNYTKTEVGTNGYETTDTALGLLKVTALYEVENDNGERVKKTASAERVVRLWNRK